MSLIRSRGIVRAGVSAACAALFASGGLGAQSRGAESVSALHAGFLTPPDAAKPMVRWWWFGAAVTKPELLRELQEMKADGIGGAELAFVYPVVLDDPAKGVKNLPFLSPEMLDAVNYAQSEGRKLGLRIDVTLCSGWPYGGPATTLAEATTRLRTVAVPVSGTHVVLPPLKEGESFISAAVARGDADKWDASSAQTLKVATDGVSVTAADGPRVVVFFIQSHTRQQVKRAAVGAEGYVLDPFSKKAVATHLRAVGDPLVKAFGATPPYAIFSDSLEAYGADWTPLLPEEFRKRRGYDLIPRLPELVAGGSPAAEKVRHDYGRTLKELVDENYLTQITDWAKAHGTKFRSQTYGDPAVSFSSQSLVDLAEGEGPQWREFSTLRWATSANHVFGNPVTSGETFTWLHSPVFRATPLDMKAEADIDFIMGENQLIFHGWPYSPALDKLPEGDPGWSLYAAGAFNDHNPWHPVMPTVTQYIARMSWLLRQGEPANQVAVLLPTDDAWAAYSPGKTSVTDAMKTLVPHELMGGILSAGYNVDYIDADAIERKGLGSHTVLVLPPTDRLPESALEKIEGFVAQGGKVVVLGHAPTMNAEGVPLAVAAMKEVVVQDASQLARALHEAAKPDFELMTEDDSVRAQVGFIRRRLPQADVYYVVNTSNRAIETTANFGTTHMVAEEWNTDTGTVSQAKATMQEIHLAPYESRVFVFGDEAAGGVRKNVTTSSAAGVDLSDDWKVTFTGTQKTAEEHTLTDWTADDATLHYSGEAVYVRDFNFAGSDGRVLLEVDGGSALQGAPNMTPEHVLDANGLPNPLITRTGPGMHAYFDPPIHEAALVVINGQPAGALWHPPYELDVTRLLKSGANHIEIRVYNTALNAWSALPAHDYKPLIAKYGDRFQMQDLNKVKPVPSGLLGHIHLVVQDGSK
jgi:hypothetical protein